MKKLLTVAILVACLVGAVPTVSASALSDDTAGVISMTCGSIRLQLRNLQKTDSRNRVLLGAKYDFILASLITPLNLRLVKNNISTNDLTTLQSTFSSERDFFKAAFTDYARSVDALIAVDCKSHPQEFYQKLEISRVKREAIHASQLRLDEVLGWYRTAVDGLRGTL